MNGHCPTCLPRVDSSVQVPLDLPKHDELCGGTRRRTTPLPLGSGAASVGLHRTVLLRIVPAEEKEAETKK